ncbi:MAG TPA: acetolactate synthase large subunit [Acidimicrobiales bacterium]|nr:acetolactate synthase large subunit [Acidimicrobiales bacterium]
MNGAQALLATLVANDIRVCFANPGTSEMHFVAGLDDTPGVRGVLCLFEGVATGAADGYARITKQPAATLLHLGPGLANGWANLHNARRARVPVLNVVGDHATYHGVYDAPLQSNIEAVASALDGWYHRCTTPDLVAHDVVNALRGAYGPPARVATLVLPADVSWGTLEDAPATWPLLTRGVAADVDDATLERAVTSLRRGHGALFLGGQLSRHQLAQAQRVAAASGARLIMETFPTSVTRGAGVVNPERLIYLSEFAQAQLRDLASVVVVGTRRPVGFFAYPDLASDLLPGECDVIDLAPPGVDVDGALAALVEATKAPALDVETGVVPGAPSGELTTQSLANALAATLPEDVIIADESNTSGLHLYGATRFAPPHELLTLTGGAIGFGLPVALGAAVASAQRVLALESDGSMLYTAQALWTMAREQLNVTIVALSNRSYAILNLERQRVGATSEGAASQQLLDLDNPTLDLAGLARSLGVAAETVTSADELVIALRRSYATPGPTLIEAMLPKGLS